MEKWTKAFIICLGLLAIASGVPKIAPNHIAQEIIIKP